MFRKHSNLIFWVIFSLLFREVICEFSGFYVDNGIGQTVMEESIPITDTQLMRRHILELLDLPDRPDNERFPSVIKSVQFILHHETVCFHRKFQNIYIFVFQKVCAQISI